jgi:hypothetical protein
VEVQRLAKEIKRIRASMSSLREVGDTSDCVILPEETICLKIVEDAENWMAKIKKISVTSSGV